MLWEVGTWDAHKHWFLKGQPQGNERMLLPWQVVIKNEVLPTFPKLTPPIKLTKVRLCLDGTESNKLIHKIEAAMPLLHDILIRWRCAKYWATVDVVKMFWSIQTHDSDARLQHCVWRENPEAKLLLYIFSRMVMGLTNSPGLARLVLVELAKQYEDHFSNAKTVLEKDT